MTIDPLAQLRLAELQTLRAELNAVIDRMNGNENFVITTLGGVIALCRTGAIGDAALWLAWTGVLIALVGARRSHELAAHLNDLDSYIARIETTLTPEGGYSTHYRRTREASPTRGISSTRALLWMGAIIASLVNLCVLVG